MTVNYKDTAISKIRNFLWQEIIDNNLLDQYDYLADGIK